MTFRGNEKNLDRLIELITVVEPNQIDMAGYTTFRQNCQTAHCLAGWAREIMKIEGVEVSDYQVTSFVVSDWLGISWEEGIDLFEPKHYREQDYYTKDEVLWTLNNLRATGKVDWREDAVEYRHRVEAQLGKTLDRSVLVSS